MVVVLSSPVENHIIQGGTEILGLVRIGGLGTCKKIPPTQRFACIVMDPPSIQSLLAISSIFEQDQGH